MTMTSMATIVAASTAYCGEQRLLRPDELRREREEEDDGLGVGEVDEQAAAEHRPRRFAAHLPDPCDGAPRAELPHPEVDEVGGPGVPDDVEEHG